MAITGNNSVGSASSFQDGSYFGQRITVSSTASVASISAYLTNTYSSSYKIQFGIYDYDTNTLVASTPLSPIITSTGGFWQTVEFTTPITLVPGDYILAIASEANVFKFHYEPSSPGDAVYRYSSNYPPLPQTIEWAPGLRVYDGGFVIVTSNLSIYASLNAPPTTTLNSPANNTNLTTTTPTLAFTATDPEGEDVSYQIQVSNSSDFSSLHMDVTTTTYASGTQQTRVVSPALTQGGIDYYWRVRAKDPSGSDSYGAWSDIRKMTTEALPPSVTSGATTAITTSQATLAGNVTATNGATIAERGFVYSTSTNPTTSDSKRTVSGQTGSMSNTLTGLSSNTTYYWRAFATNSKGTTYGVNRNFTTETIPPAVNTGAVSNITLSTATVATSLGANPDNQTITERGVAYSTSQNPTISNSTQAGTDSINLSGLSENTTYYVRAYVKWSGGTSYGSQTSLKTQGVPTVGLNSPANSGSTGDIRSRLEFTGTDPDDDQVTYQLQLNTSSTFTSPLVDVSSAIDTGFTNQSVSKTDPFYSGNKIRYTLQQDLTRGSTYYWRVRAKDPSGTNTWGSWSSTYSFTVSATTPTVTIASFSDILDTSLKATGSITDDGGATVTERGVVWSTSPNPTTANGKATATGNPFTASATGLTASTEYHFRAYATNSAGTAYSADTTQMTLQPLAPPTVTTTTATEITDITAKVGGEVTLDGRRTVTERGVVFGTSANPTTADNKLTDVTGGLGTYTGTITGLNASTVYHYRAYAVNDQGTGYGADKTFTTADPFVPDQGDGAWTFSVSGSDAIVSRNQATGVHSSANLPLADLYTLENGKTYTLAVGDISADYGSPKLVLQWFEGATKKQQTIAPNTSYTFTYNTSYIHWNLRFFVTQGTAESNELTATFKSLYLAEEPSFSSFVPFIARGVTEIKIVNNQIVDKRRQDVINSIYTKLRGFNYYPFEITTEGLGWLEIGDGFTIAEGSDSYNVIPFDWRMTLDGGIGETLKADIPEKTTTDYSKAGNITKLISNTTLQVDKQKQTIEGLVADVYDNDGYVEEKFTQVYQDINQVKTTVQGAGGVNLIRNSAMYAYNNLGYPDSWTTTVGSSGTITIQGSPESRSAGGISGNSFTLKDASTKQTVTVKKDADFIPDDQKTYYTFNVKVKKNLVGTAYVKLSNRNETHQIDLPTGQDYYWEDVTIEGLLPQDTYYDIELQSSTDAEAQFTDAMLSIGETGHTWTQAPGEVGNTQFAITEDGATFRQAQFRYNYTKMDALGFYVVKKILGTQEQIFGFTGDVTNVSRLKAEKSIAMGGLRIVPINLNGENGWAFTKEVS